MRVAVVGAEGGGLLQAVAEDGTPQGPPEPVRDLPAAVAAVATTNGTWICPTVRGVSAAASRRLTTIPWFSSPPKRISSVSSTRLVRIVVSAFQPTIRRLNASMTNAT